MPCAFSDFMASPSSLRQSVAVALCDGVGDRRQRCDHGGDRERGAAFIVDGGDHAVILQLELLIERELRQRALLDDREGSRMPQATATVSEMARIRRTAIERILNMRRTEAPGDEGSVRDFMNCLTTGVPAGP